MVRNIVLVSIFLCLVTHNATSKFTPSKPRLDAVAVEEEDNISLKSLQKSDVSNIYSKINTRRPPLFANEASEPDLRKEEDVIDAFLNYPTREPADLKTENKDAETFESDVRDTENSSEKPRNAEIEMVTTVNNYEDPTTNDNKDPDDSYVKPKRIFRKKLNQIKLNTDFRVNDIPVVAPYNIDTNILRNKIDKNRDLLSTATVMDLPKTFKRKGKLLRKRVKQQENAILIEDSESISESSTNYDTLQNRDVVKSEPTTENSYEITTLKTFGKKRRLLRRKKVNKKLEENYPKSISEAVILSEKQTPQESVATGPEIESTGTIPTMENIFETTPAVTKATIAKKISETKPIQTKAYLETTTSKITKSRSRNDRRQLRFTTQAEKFTTTPTPRYVRFETTTTKVTKSQSRNGEERQRKRFSTTTEKTFTTTAPTPRRFFSETTTTNNRFYLPTTTPVNPYQSIKDEVRQTTLRKEETNVSPFLTARTTTDFPQRWRTTNQPMPTEQRQYTHETTKFPTDSTTRNGKSQRERPTVIPIIKSENRVFSHNGEFRYSYEGGDGTRAESQGVLKTSEKGKSGEAVFGSFSYTDKDGNDFSLSYTADERGYQAVGAHLPTPPPIPPAIARMLEYLATKPTPEPVTKAPKNRN